MRGTTESCMKELKAKTGEQKRSKDGESGQDKEERTEPEN
jgi:hypothetical protein